MAFLKCLPQELYNWDFVHSELDRQGKEKPHLCTALFYIDQRNEGEEFIITGAMRKGLSKTIHVINQNEIGWCYIDRRYENKDEEGPGHFPSRPAHLPLPDLLEVNLKQKNFQNGTLPFCKRDPLEQQFRSF